MKIICDTNFFIRLFEQNPDTMAELSKIGSQNVLLPSVSLMELIAGMRDFRLNQVLQIPDALIGAIALSYKLELYTYNLKDFRFIPGIRLYAYAHI